MLAHIARTYDRGYGHFTHAPEHPVQLAAARGRARHPGRARRRSRCTPSRPAATASATSPPITSPASRPTSSSIPSSGARSCASGRRSIPSSPTCRASSRSRSPAPTPTAPRPGCTTSACTPCANDARRASASTCSSAAASAARRSSATSIREFLPWQHLLTYLEAILRVYNRYGRRDNMYKARIKILVKALGAGGVPPRGRGGVGAPEGRPGDADAGGSRAHRGALHPARLRAAAGAVDLAVRRRRSPTDRAFATWTQRNVHPHKVPGYAAVTLSLKKTGVPPGDATADQMDAVADLADRYSFGELRVSHEQNLMLADVRAARPARAVAGSASRSAWPRPTSACSPTSSPARAATSARSPTRKSIPVAEAIQRALRRPRLPARHRRARPQHLRLHERLRPSPRRPHRHPRRRQAGRGVLPDLDRRRAGRRARRVAGQGDRPVVRAGRGARRHREADRGLSRRSATARKSASSTPCAASASNLSRNTCMAHIIKDTGRSQPTAGSCLTRGRRIGAAAGCPGGAT